MRQFWRSVGRTGGAGACGIVELAFKQWPTLGRPHGVGISVSFFASFSEGKASGGRCGEQRRMLCAWGFLHSLEDLMLEMTRTALPHDQ